MKVLWKGGERALTAGKCGREGYNGGAEGGVSGGTSGDEAVELRSGS